MNFAENNENLKLKRRPFLFYVYFSEHISRQDAPLFLSDREGIISGALLRAKNEEKNEKKGWGGGLNFLVVLLAKV